MAQALSTWFAYPALLGVLAAIPCVALLMLHARRRRRQALALLGQVHALQKLEWPRPTVRRWRSVCLFLGLACLSVGAAAPRWGKLSVPIAQGSGRSLAIVLDVSRSMLAEQPSRQELARRALRHLAAGLAEQGGPRVALVIFAAHARIVFPLTSDFDHLGEALTQIDADDLPPALRPQGADGAVSGTRTGAALRLALQVFDAKTAGDILLISDGDDPAGDDEWLEGAEEARRHQIPVHTIGVGNARADAVIPFGSGVLEFAGQPVKTRLREKPLQEIARRTRGTYVPAHTEFLPLGKLLPSILAARLPDATSEQERTMPALQPRFAWFLAPALVFLALTLVLGERRGPARKVVPRFVSALVAMALVSAAPMPVEQALRQGIEAFERGDAERALRWFEEAEESAPDPGLVAFNKAAALYRLERYGEAALHYQRCLEDNAIPAGRQARAYFQMANAYLRDSAGTRRDLLEKSLAAYRACLLMNETDGDLRSDAAHNLELARLLWLKTLPDPENPPRNDDQGPQPKGSKPKNAKSSDGAKNGKSADEHGIQDGAEPGKGDPKSSKVKGGPLTVLPDRAELVPLSPQETEAHLSDISRRISQERRQYRRHASRLLENVKDW